MPDKHSFPRVLAGAVSVARVGAERVLENIQFLRE